MKKELAILTLAFYAFFTPISSSAQQTVGLFTKNTGEQDGYVLFSPNASNNTYLIDKCGKLIHQWYTGDIPGLDAYLLPNGNLLSTGRTNDPYFANSGSCGGFLQTFDWNGKLLWSYYISDSIIHQDHDVYPLANGNILVCEWERFTAAQAIAAGRDSVKLKGNPIWSVKIQEIKTVGSAGIQVVWEWRLWDHLIQDHDSTKANYGVVVDHPELLNINYEDPAGFTSISDWSHANAVTYNPDLDQVMISVRNMSEIYIIDHSATTAQAASHSGGKHNRGGDFLYRWGNPAAYNRGNKSNQRLFVQHNPSWIPDGYPGAGTITVFNDGTGRSQGNYSSADIFAPPVNSNGDYELDSGKAYGPDSAYWSYVAPKPTSFYSAVQGGVQKLSNGNILICNATSGDFFEVDSNKNLVWRYVCPINGSGPISQGTKNLGDITCFRANLYPENYPAFKDMTLSPLGPIELNPYSYNCTMNYVKYPSPLYNIAQLKGYNAITGSADSLYMGSGFIEGVVESQNLGSDSIQFSLIDGTGAITITSSLSYMPSIGDSILVGGVVTQVNGLIEFAADTIILKPTGTWQKKPDVVTQLGESIQSDLIIIRNVWLADTSEWKANGVGFDVAITNGTDTFMMYINSNTDLFTKKAPLGKFNITGIEIQDKPTEPFFGNYEIEPRGGFDFERIIPFYKIRQLRVQNLSTGVADSAGSRNNFYLKGIVQSPDFNSNGLDFSIKDSTGSIIVIAKTDINNFVPSVGDSIELRGLLTQVNGLIEVVADSIILPKNSSPILTPTLVSDLSESHEAQLVKLNGYYIVNKSKWIAFGDSFTVNITNGVNTFGMRINSTTDLFKKRALTGVFNITGIEIQNHAFSPYFGDYLIEPRGSFDFERVVQLYKIRQVRSQNPITGIADSAGSRSSFYLKGIVQSPDFRTNQLEFSLMDSTGSIIVIANFDVDNYKPNVGDSIELRGILTQYNGLIEVIADSISFIKNSLTDLQPTLVSDLSETNEAQLVKLNNYHVVNPSNWVMIGDSFLVSISNGTNMFLMRINATTDLSKMKALKGVFNISGIEIQNKFLTPYFGNYEIEPRGSFDIERVVQLYKIRQVKVQDMTTGIADSAGSPNNFYLKGIVQSPDLRKGELYFSIMDSTGSIIVTSATDVNGYIPRIGDSVEVRGLLTQVDGLIEVDVDSISILKNAKPVLDPLKVVTLVGSDQAKLVKLYNYYLIDTSQWKPNGNVFDVKITNSVDTFMMEISPATDLYTSKPLLGVFDINGIEIQEQPSAPYFGNYEIIPRGSFDIERVIQLYKIREVRGQDLITGIADSSGSLYSFHLKGIVQSPDFTSTGLNFSMEDSTGSIMVVSTIDINGYMPKVGDSIELRGLLTQVNGLTEVVTDSISVLKKASPIINSIVVSELTESTEAQLITLNGYYLSDTSQWKPLGGGFDVGITNGTDNYTMHISSETNLFKGKPLVGIFNITGIEIQNQPNSPYLGDYKIEPRGSFDLERVVQMYKIKYIRVQDAVSGIADSAGSLNSFYLKGIVQSPDFNATGLNFSIKDSTGSIMVVSASDINGYIPVVGDSIELRGLLTQVNGLIEVVSDLISVLKSASPVTNAIVVPALTESTEAQLVKLRGYYLTDATQWKASGTGFDVNITNGIDTFGMRIGSGTDLFKSKTLFGVFDIAGIEIQNKTGLPYFGKYLIEPRGSFDLKIVDKLYKIRQIRVQDPVSGIADSAGSIHPFFLKGIVQSPDFTTSGYEFSIKDSTGSIFVEASTTINNYTPNVGDSVEIRGKLNQVNGLTVVVVDSISQLKGSSPVLVPQIITSLSESTEAKLVKYDKAWLVDPSQWVATGTGFSADITNGIDTIQLYINSSTNAFTMPAPKGRFNVTGIGSQNKTSAPYIGGYQLWPTAIVDFQFLPINLYKIGEVKGNNTVTGIADSMNMYCFLKGIVQSGNLSGNATEFYSLQDLTGAITVTSLGMVNGYTPATGDSIEVRGTVLQLNGLTYFATDSISKISAGVQISPVVVASLNENTESGLVTMQGYRLVDGTKWDTTGAKGSFEVKANNGSDTITLKIVSGTDLYINSARPVHEFNVTGIGSQSDLTIPYLKDYYLIPRSMSDIEQSTGIAQENYFNTKLEVYPNPTSGYVNVAAGFNISEIRVTDMVGKILYRQIPGGYDAYRLDLSSLKQGVYFVEVYDGINDIVTKVIKE